MKLHYVDANYIQQMWPAAEKYLADALEKDPGDAEYNIHHVRQFVVSGQWLLLVVVDDDGMVHGAATVSFTNYPLHRVAFMTTTGGKFVANPEMFEQFVEIVKRLGATKVQAFCRESMVRLLDKCGFKHRTNLVEVTL
jgi:hypothetical protein